MGQLNIVTVLVSLAVLVVIIALFAYINNKKSNSLHPTIASLLLI